MKVSILISTVVVSIIAFTTDTVQAAAASPKSFPYFTKVNYLMDNGEGFVVNTKCPSVLLTSGFVLSDSRCCTKPTSDPPSALRKRAVKEPSGHPFEGFGVTGPQDDANVFGNNTVSNWRHNVTKFMTSSPLRFALGQMNPKAAGTVAKIHKAAINPSKDKLSVLTWGYTSGGNEYQSLQQMGVQLDSNDRCKAVAGDSFTGLSGPTVCIKTTDLSHAFTPGSPLVMQVGSTYSIVGFCTVATPDGQVNLDGGNGRIGDWPSNAVGVCNTLSSQLGWISDTVGVGENGLVDQQPSPSSSKPSSSPSKSSSASKSNSNSGGNGGNGGDGGNSSQSPPDNNNGGTPSDGGSTDQPTDSATDSATDTGTDTATDSATDSSTDSSGSSSSASSQSASSDAIRNGAIILTLVTAFVATSISFLIAF